MDRQQSYRAFEHVMICGATAPGIVKGVDHEHECHQPARRPDQTEGVMRHKCHLCPMSWTESRPAPPWTLANGKPVWPVWKGVAFVSGLPLALLAVVLIVSGLVGR